MDEFLEIDRIQAAVEFVQPYMAVRRAVVDQRRDPPAVADRDRVRQAKLHRHEDGEGDTLAGLLERHPLRAGQGRVRRGGGARRLAELHAVEPEHVGDNRAALRDRHGQGDDSQRYDQGGTPPGIQDPREPACDQRGARLVAPLCFQALADGGGLLCG